MRGCSIIQINGSEPVRSKKCKENHKTVNIFYYLKQDKHKLDVSSKSPFVGELVVENY